jgi:hypothetical protein
MNQEASASGKAVATRVADRAQDESMTRSAEQTKTPTKQATVDRHPKKLSLAFALFKVIERILFGWTED